MNRADNPIALGSVPRSGASVPGAEPFGMTEGDALTLHVAAQKLQSQGRHGEAIDALDRVVDYFVEVEGELSRDLANVLTDLSESLSALCRYMEAEAAAHRSNRILDSLREILDPESRGMLVPRAAVVWGRTLRELGRYEEASAPLLEAISEAKLFYGPDAPETAASLNEYGILCKYWGKFDEGEGAYLRALKLIEDRYGSESPATASVYHNLGGLEHARGDFARGEPLARKAYEIRKLALGADHPDTVADSVAWCGLLDGLGRFEESIPVYRRSLLLYEGRLGPNHFEVAATLNNLGMALAATGSEPEGRDLLSRALDIKHNLFEPHHPEILLTESNLSRLRPGG
jgi:tetratricopeptide (TPR) repeat protein